MKKNRKGFMLAEAVVSATVIITSMVMLYSTFNRLYSLYMDKNNYYNIDAFYATKEMINYLMDNNFEEEINNIFQNDTYKTLINSTTCLGGNVCSKLKDLYSVNNMIISEYDKSTLEVDIKTLAINQSFKDYIDYVIGYYGVSNHDTKYSYIVLTELKVGSNYYYANIGIG
jgi:hypothetical protein